MNRLTKPSRWQRFKSALGIGKRSGAVYEAAGHSRTRKGWTSTNYGPNTAAASAPRIRARARDAVRNEAHACRAADVVSGAIIGTGIMPSFSLPQRAGASLLSSVADADARELADLRRLWERWGKRADITEKQCFEMLQLIAARALYIDGEVFVLRRQRRTGEGVSLRLEVLEADQLDELKNEHLTQGRRIVQGVEYDETGLCVAYHFRRDHPGETWIGLGLSIETVRVPASDVIHLQAVGRPQQSRGVSMMAPSLVSKADLGDFERFHLTSKKMEAMIMGAVVPSDDLAPPPGHGPSPEIGTSARFTDAQGNIVETLEPGLMVTAENGKDVRFFQPSAVGGYAEFKRSMLQSIAVGWKVTYELLTGDLSQVNYSSLRAGMLEFWRFVDQMQWLVVIPQMLDRVAEWWLEAAYLEGLIASPLVGVEWSPPKRHQVDPSKDILADVMKIRAGLEPRDSVVEEYGWTFDQVLASAKRTREMLEEAGVMLDSDPNTYDFRGASKKDAPLPDETTDTED